MKLNKIIVLIIFIVKSNILFSQEFKIKDVTIQDLSETVNQIEKSASAAYLFKIGETKFRVDNDGSYLITTRVDLRLKIYDSEGLKYGNFEIPFYINGSRERVDIKKGYTYNLENNEIVKTKLRNENEFIQELDENWALKKVTFPNVKAGSIIELSYTFESPYVSKLDNWNFQYDIPVQYNEYVVNTPQSLIYRTVLSGYEEIQSETKNFNNQSSAITKTTFYGNNLISIKDESFVDNLNNYVSAVKFELVAANNRNIAVDWEGLIKTIYNNSNFGDELRKTNYFEDQLMAIVDDKKSDFEKAKSVYNFIQKEFTWNSERGVYCKQGVKKTFKEKKGNVAEINLILISMLRKLGLNANPLILSTKANGISIFPNKSSFDYVICSLFIDDTYYFLDGSNKNAYFNIIPIKTMNWVGKIIKENGTFEDVHFYNFPKSIQKTSILATLDNEGKIKGMQRKQSNDFNAFVFREKFKNASKESILEHYEELYKVDVSSYEVKDLHDNEKQITEDLKFDSSNLIENLGNKILISPLLFHKLDENPFKTELRKYPLDFKFKSKLVISITLDLGTDYSIEFLPQSKSITSESGSISYSFSIADVNNKIQVIKTFEINNSMVPANEYLSIKILFEEILKTETEKIVLLKK